MCGEKSGFCQRSILHLGSPPRMRGKAIVIQRVDRLGGITPACAGKRTPLLTPRSVTWDHPRVCGEKPESGRWGEQDAGSPPRMRGKAPRFLIAKGLFRITPAYAGKSVKVNEPDCLPRDHPRVCGEKTSSNVPERKNPGSPPRMQGKGCPLLFRYYFIGITPACAGKSYSPPQGSKRQGDHPRVCGEKKDNPDEWSEVQGSPPRVRGKEEMLYQGRHSSGITPACAGKRDKAGLPFVPVRDHPRVCGEKSGRVRPWRKHKGSPPRVRGKGVRSTCIPALTRITPACAGKRRNAIPRAAFFRDHPRVCGEKSVQSSAVWCIPGSPPRMRGKARYIAASVALFWDHPRVCGEKKKMNMRKDKRMGSPPRMRGKADYTPVVDVRVRITPAYAGKSDNFVVALSDFGDHPRVCGEKCSATGSGLAVSGSPPRMRGKVPVVSSVSVQFGITPAYAGKRSFAIVLSSDYWDHPRVCGEK